jgi:type II secretory pathway predicted ATPase ExeA
MIRSHFAIAKDPFVTDPHTGLLAHQAEIFEVIKVHSHQGGFCLILGNPGTGKTVLKNAIIHHRPKDWITPVINRSLHTWQNILRLLCEALGQPSDGGIHACETRLIKEARTLHSKGKQIIPIIDDAQHLPSDALRKLRLLLEDFPKSHNLILIGQLDLNTELQLKINEDIRSRITYSAILKPLAPDAVQSFIHAELDRIGLAHATFTQGAIDLIARGSEGVLRLVKNLCVGAMIEAVRHNTREVDIRQVNNVLIQPHWRLGRDHEKHESVKLVNDRPDYGDK